jgi:hypothetical protein
MFAALDLATGQMFYRFRDRKRRPHHPNRLTAREAHEH